jgi:hypothetical protein
MELEKCRIHGDQTTTVHRRCALHQAGFTHSILGKIMACHVAAIGSPEDKDPIVASQPFLT